MRRDRPWLFWGGIGLLGFAVMMGFEIYGEDSPPVGMELLGDALETALLVGCAIGIGVIASRMGRARS